MSEKTILIEEVEDKKMRRKLQSLAIRRMELKEREELLEEEKESLASEALTLLEDAQIESLKVAGVGLLSRTKNSPRASLDKDAMRVYLVEKGVKVALVQAAIEAATSFSKVNKPYSLRYTPEKG